MHWYWHISRSGVDSENLKRSGALCQPPWLTNEENFSSRWSIKAKVTLETISFWQNISISIFKFSPFLYTTKACQWISSIFQNLQTLWWGRRKNTQQSMKKEKLRKVVCFIKSFKMIMNHFFVSQAHSQPNFCFFKSEWRKKYQKAN